MALPMTAPTSPAHVILGNQAPLDSWAHGTDIAVIGAAALAFVAIVVAIVLARKAAQDARRDRRYTFELGLLAEMAVQWARGQEANSWGHLRALVRDANNTTDLPLARVRGEVMPTAAGQAQDAALEAGYRKRYGDHQYAMPLHEERQRLVLVEIQEAIERRVRLDK